MFKKLLNNILVSGISEPTQVPLNARSQYSISQLQLQPDVISSLKKILKDTSAQNIQTDRESLSQMKRQDVVSRTLDNVNAVKDSNNISEEPISQTSNITQINSIGNTDMETYSESITKEASWSNLNVSGTSLTEEISENEEDGELNISKSRKNIDGISNQDQKPRAESFVNIKNENTDDSKIISSIQTLKEEKELGQQPPSLTIEKVKGEMYDNLDHLFDENILSYDTATNSKRIRISLAKQWINSEMNNALMSKNKNLPGYIKEPSRIRGPYTGAQDNKYLSNETFSSSSFQQNKNTITTTQKKIKDNKPNIENISETIVIDDSTSTYIKIKKTDSILSLYDINFLNSIDIVLLFHNHIKFANKLYSFYLNDISSLITNSDTLKSVIEPSFNIMKNYICGLKLIVSMCYNSCYSYSLTHLRINDELNCKYTNKWDVYNLCSEGVFTDETISTLIKLSLNEYFLIENKGTYKLHELICSENGDSNVGFSFLSGHKSFNEIIPEKLRLEYIVAKLHPFLVFVCSFVFDLCDNINIIEKQENRKNVDIFSDESSQRYYEYTHIINSIFLPEINYNIIVEDNYRVWPSTNVFINRYDIINNIKKMKAEQVSVKTSLFPKRSTFGSKIEVKKAKNGTENNTKKDEICYKRFLLPIHILAKLGVSILELSNVNTYERNGKDKMDDTLLEILSRSMIFKEILNIIREYMQTEYKLKSSLRFDISKLMLKYINEGEAGFYKVNYSAESVFTDIHLLNKEFYDKILLKLYSYQHIDALSISFGEDIKIFTNYVISEIVKFKNDSSIKDLFVLFKENICLILDSNALSEGDVTDGELKSSNLCRLFFYLKLFISIIKENRSSVISVFISSGIVRILISLFSPRNKNNGYYNNDGEISYQDQDENCMNFNDLIDVMRKDVEFRTLNTKDEIVKENRRGDNFLDKFTNPILPIIDDNLDTKNNNNDNQEIFFDLLYEFVCVLLCFNNSIMNGTPFLHLKANTNTDFISQKRGISSIPTILEIINPKEILNLFYINFVQAMITRNDKNNSKHIKIFFKCMDLYRNILEAAETSDAQERMYNIERKDSKTYNMFSYFVDSSINWINGMVNFSMEINNCGEDESCDFKISDVVTTTLSSILRLIVELFCSNPSILLTISKRYCNDVLEIIEKIIRSCSKHEIYVELMPVISVIYGCMITGYTVLTNKDLKFSLCSEPKYKRIQREMFNNSMPMSFGDKNYLKYARNRSIHCIYQIINQEEDIDKVMNSVSIILAYLLTPSFNVSEFCKTTNDIIVSPQLYCDFLCILANVVKYKDNYMEYVKWVLCDLEKIQFLKDNSDVKNINCINRDRMFISIATNPSVSSRTQNIMLCKMITIVFNTVERIKRDSRIDDKSSEYSKLFDLFEKLLWGLRDKIIINDKPFLLLNRMLNRELVRTKSSDCSKNQTDNLGKYLYQYYRDIIQMLQMLTVRQYVKPKASLKQEVHKISTDIIGKTVEGSYSYYSSVYSSRRKFSIIIGMWMKPEINNTIIPVSGSNVEFKVAPAIFNTIDLITLHSLSLQHVGVKDFSDENAKNIYIPSLTLTYSLDTLRKVMIFGVNTVAGQNNNSMLYCLPYSGFTEKWMHITLIVIDSLDWRKITGQKVKKEKRDQGISNCFIKLYVNGIKLEQMSSKQGNYCGEDYPVPINNNTSSVKYQTNERDNLYRKKSILSSLVSKATQNQNPNTNEMAFSRNNQPKKQQRKKIKYKMGVLSIEKQTTVIHSVENLFILFLKQDAVKDIEKIPIALTLLGPTFNLTPVLRKCLRFIKNIRINQNKHNDYKNFEESDKESMSLLFLEPSSPSRIQKTESNNISGRTEYFTTHNVEQEGFCVSFDKEVSGSPASMAGFNSSLLKDIDKLQHEKQKYHNCFSIYNDAITRTRNIHEIISESIKRKFPKEFSLFGQSTNINEKLLSKRIKKIGLIAQRFQYQLLCCKKYTSIPLYYQNNLQTLHKKENSAGRIKQSPNNKEKMVDTPFVDFLESEIVAVDSFPLKYKLKYLKTNNKYGIANIGPGKISPRSMCNINQKIDIEQSPSSKYNTCCLSQCTNYRGSCCYLESDNINAKKFNESERKIKLTKNDGMNVGPTRQHSMIFESTSGCETYDSRIINVFDYNKNMANILLDNTSSILYNEKLEETKTGSYRIICGDSVNSYIINEQINDNVASSSLGSLSNEKVLGVSAFGGTGSGINYSFANSGGVNVGTKNQINYGTSKYSKLMNNINVDIQLNNDIECDKNQKSGSNLPYIWRYHRSFAEDELFAPVIPGNIRVSNDFGYNTLISPGIKALLYSITRSVIFNTKGKTMNCYYYPHQTVFNFEDIEEKEVVSKNEIGSILLNNYFGLKHKDSLRKTLNDEYNNQLLKKNEDKLQDTALKFNFEISCQSRNFGYLMKDIYISKERNSGSYSTFSDNYTTLSESRLTLPSFIFCYDTKSFFSIFSLCVLPFLIDEKNIVSLIYENNNFTNEDKSFINSMYKLQSRGSKQSSELQSTTVKPTFINGDDSNKQSEENKKNEEINKRKINSIQNKDINTSQRNEIRRESRESTSLNKNISESSESSESSDNVEEPELNREVLKNKNEDTHLLTVRDFISSLDIVESSSSNMFQYLNNLIQAVDIVCENLYNNKMPKVIADILISIGLSDFESASEYLVTSFNYNNISPFQIEILKNIINLNKSTRMSDIYYPFFKVLIVDYFIERGSQHVMRGHSDEFHSQCTSNNDPELVIPYFYVFYKLNELLKRLPNNKSNSKEILITHENAHGLGYVREKHILSVIRRDGLLTSSLLTLNEILSVQNINIYNSTEEENEDEINSVRQVCSFIEMYYILIPRKGDIKLLYDLIVKEQIEFLNISLRQGDKYIRESNGLIICENFRIFVLVMINRIMDLSLEVVKNVINRDDITLSITVGSGINNRKCISLKDELNNISDKYSNLVNELSPVSLHFRKISPNDCQIQTNLIDQNSKYLLNALKDNPIIVGDISICLWNYICALECADAQSAVKNSNIPATLKCFPTNIRRILSVFSNRYSMYILLHSESALQLRLCLRLMNICNQMLFPLGLYSGIIGNPDRSLLLHYDIINYKSLLLSILDTPSISKKYFGLNVEELVSPELYKTISNMLFGKQEMSLGDIMNHYSHHSEIREVYDFFEGTQNEKINETDKSLGVIKNIAMVPVLCTMMTHIYSYNNTRYNMVELHQLFIDKIMCIINKESFMINHLISDDCNTVFSNKKIFDSMIKLLTKFKNCSYKTNDDTNNTTDDHIDYFMKEINSSLPNESEALKIHQSLSLNIGLLGGFIKSCLCYMVTCLSESRYGQTDLDSGKYTLDFSSDSVVGGTISCIIHIISSILRSTSCNDEINLKNIFISIIINTLFSSVDEEIVLRVETEMFYNIRIKLALSIIARIIWLLFGNVFEAHGSDFLDKFLQCVEEQKSTEDDLELSEMILFGPLLKQDNFSSKKYQKDEIKNSEKQIPSFKLNNDIQIKKEALFEPSENMLETIYILLLSLIYIKGALDCEKELHTRRFLFKLSFDIAFSFKTMQFSKLMTKSSKYLLEDVDTIFEKLVQIGTAVLDDNYCNMIILNYINNNRKVLNFSTIINANVMTLYDNKPTDIQSLYIGETQQQCMYKIIRSPEFKEARTKFKHSLSILLTLFFKKNEIKKINIQDSLVNLCETLSTLIYHVLTSNFTLTFVTLLETNPPNMDRYIESVSKTYLINNLEDGPSNEFAAMFYDKKSCDSTVSNCKMFFKKIYKIPTLISDNISKPSIKFIQKTKLMLIDSDIIDQKNQIFDKNKSKNQGSLNVFSFPYSIQPLCSVSVLNTMCLLQMRNLIRDSIWTNNRKIFDADIMRIFSKKGGSLGLSQWHFNKDSFALKRCFKEIEFRKMPIMVKDEHFASKFLNGQNINIFANNDEIKDFNYDEIDVTIFENYIRADKNEETDHNCVIKGYKDQLCYKNNNNRQKCDLSKMTKMEGDSYNPNDYSDFLKFEFPDILLLYDEICHIIIKKFIKGKAEHQTLVIKDIICSGELILYAGNAKIVTPEIPDQHNTFGEGVLILTNSGVYFIPSVHIDDSELTSIRYLDVNKNGNGLIVKKKGYKIDSVDKYYLNLDKKLTVRPYPSIATLIPDYISYAWGRMRGTMCELLMGIGIDGASTHFNCGNNFVLDPSNGSFSLLDSMLSLFIKNKSTYNLIYDAHCVYDPLPYYNAYMNLLYYSKFYYTTLIPNRTLKDLDAYDVITDIINDSYKKKDEYNVISLINNDNRIKNISILWNKDKYYNTLNSKSQKTWLESTNVISLSLLRHCTFFVSYSSITSIFYHNHTFNGFPCMIRLESSDGTSLNIAMIDESVSMRECVELSSSISFRNYDVILNRCAEKANSAMKIISYNIRRYHAEAEDTLENTDGWLDGKTIAKNDNNDDDECYISFPIDNYSISYNKYPYTEQKGVFIHIKQYPILSDPIMNDVIIDNNKQCKSCLLKFTHHKRDSLMNSPLGLISYSNGSYVTKEIGVSLLTSLVRYKLLSPINYSSLVSALAGRSNYNINNLPVIPVSYFYQNMKLRPKFTKIKMKCNVIHYDVLMDEDDEYGDCYLSQSYLPQQDFDQEEIVNFIRENIGEIKRKKDIFVLKYRKNLYINIFNGMNEISNVSENNEQEKSGENKYEIGKQLSYYISLKDGVRIPYLPLGSIQYPRTSHFLTMYDSTLTDSKDRRAYFEKTNCAKDLLLYKKKNEIASFNNIYNFSHYGTNYSNITSIINIFVRIQPYTMNMLELYGGKFDETNRLTKTIVANNNGCISATTNIREAIIDMFYQPLFTSNLNDLNFGYNSSRVDDIIGKNEEGSDLNEERIKIGDLDIPITIIKGDKDKQKCIITPDYVNSLHHYYLMVNNMIINSPLMRKNIVNFFNMFVGSQRCDWSRSGFNKYNQNAYRELLPPHIPMTYQSELLLYKNVYNWEENKSVDAIAKRMSDMYKISETISNFGMVCDRCSQKDLRTQQIEIPQLYNTVIESEYNGKVNYESVISTIVNLDDGTNRYIRNAPWDFGVKREWSRQKSKWILKAKISDSEFLMISKHNIKDKFGTVLLSIINEEITCVAISSNDLLLIGLSSGELALYQLMRIHTIQAVNLSYIGTSHEVNRSYNILKKPEIYGNNDNNNGNNKQINMAYLRRFVPYYKKQKNNILALELMKERSSELIRGMKYNKYNPVTGLKLRSIVMNSCLFSDMIFDKGDIKLHNYNDSYPTALSISKFNDLIHVGYSDGHIATISSESYSVLSIMNIKHIYGLPICHIESLDNGYIMASTMHKIIVTDGVGVLIMQKEFKYPITCVSVEDKPFWDFTKCVCVGNMYGFVYFVNIHSGKITKKYDIKSIIKKRYPSIYYAIMEDLNKNKILELDLYSFNQQNLFQEIIPNPFSIKHIKIGGVLPFQVAVLTANDIFVSLEPVPAPKSNWVPDESSTCCSICKSTFTTVRRRHHCRSCGALICSGCIFGKMAVEHMNYHKPVIVCSLCAARLKEESRLRELGCPTAVVECEDTGDDFLIFGRV